MADSIKKKTIYGLIWQFSEKFGTQIVTFFVSVILARLLTPEDYGVVGLITVFITVALVFAQSGMGQALVQKKEADDNDFYTVFCYSLAVSVVIYFILFFSAGLIADFYNEPKLKLMIRILSVTIIIGAISNVLVAKIQREMQFKTLFYSNLTGTVASAFVGIVMAYAGFGVWSLIVQQLVMQIINTCVLWFVIGWSVARGEFSLKKMRELFGYSWKLLCSTLIDTVYDNAYMFIIGKTYSARELGYYHRGNQFPVLIVQNLNAAMDGVLFPALSKMQGETERLKSAVRRSVSLSTYVVFPAMAGLAAIAEPLVKLLLTEKWLPAVPFVRFCCFMYALWPLHTANLQTIKAIGRSDIFLKLEIIKKIFGVSILLFTVKYGIMAMMVGACVTDLICCVVNAFPNKRLIGYSFTEQLYDILPATLLSSVMLFVVYVIGFINVNIYFIMAIQLLVGISVYFGLSLLFKTEALRYILNTISELKAR